MPAKLQWNQHSGYRVESAKGFDVIECERCGFKHIIPIPSTKELEEAYQHEYYTREKPLYLERHREDLDWWNLVYAERYEVLENFLSEDRRRMLDVGSGPGFFLLHGKNRGWQVKGIEPSVQAAEHSYGLGLDVINDFFSEESAALFGRFDAVNMSDVLEHIPEPASILSLVYDQLDEGGLVCISVPNDFNPFQLVLRDQMGFKPWWVAPPHHINYFDFESLSKLIQRCGFEVVHTEATFPIDMFLLMGDNYIGDDGIGRICHARRKQFEMNLYRGGMSKVKSELYEKIACVGLGREVVIFGRKR
ncbi:class I SAM-dependent methyltransferase [Methanocalculus taiwanensis]|uniref:Class I SAM-dependent methyltransferase n=1 Tax=Methanocalculus taiwanensis TaxID=106207 RepID=A0ABD4TKX4_9EURY|nr:class I SAM-dependent methyltransferase [Methanocalculus taiwanensis]MCQ1538192.1 class I SAM-dependent methyltransferase [Methanocalculus taiwanensis]